MRYISLFSGIESASAAWEPMGWAPVCFSEIEPFPRAVLSHRFPDVPLHGDMTGVDWHQYQNQADVVVAGAPCQAFSVAGARQSLDDDRGNLTLATIEALNAIRPEYFVFENVPGILSTKDNAFGCFLGGLVGADSPLQPPGRCRWSDAGLVSGPDRRVAWRILDAQHFGVPQRRRRVFVVGCPRTGADPAEILFEPKSLNRDVTPSRKAREETAAPTLPGSKKKNRPWVATGGGTGKPINIAPTIESPCNRLELASEAFIVYENHGQDSRIKPIDKPTINAKAGTGGNNLPLIQSDLNVRRLTPTECERLQGFSDGWTQVPYRKKPAADGPRYKALGNAMAVPVMRWIGEQIGAQ